MSNVTNEKTREDQPVTVLEDNPCWGSRTRHKLEDLLSIIDRTTSVVYDSPQYLVLNKPPDLRMDGPYAATVHKLLTYWYPPPSLTTKTQNESENHQQKSRDKLLLEAISRLRVYNNVRDNFIRPCHQLDYATSGVLLVAKTKGAANHISRLFEDRHEGVQKSYMAIVVGDLRRGLLCNDSANESKVPIWTEGNTTRELREQLQRIEEKYRQSRAAVGKQHCRVRDARKSKNKKNKRSSFKGGTFDGFQPAHALFAKWKSKLKSETSVERNAEESSSPLKKRQKRRKLKKNSAVFELLTDDDWKKIWDPVDEAVEEDPAVLIGFEKLEWKFLHEKHPNFKQAITMASDIHNDILRNAIKEKEQKLQEEAQKDMEGDNPNSGNELPVLFRLSEKTETDGNGNSDDNTFYVCCPLAQHPDQFKMVIPTTMGREFPHLTSPNNKDDGENNESDNRLKFRPSLTKCTILESGTISIERNSKETKIDVTKVRLFPMTGRRHQLRVHMALTGFPILGDVAYGGDRYVRQKDDEKEQTENDICSRMCLHAQSLQLPTLIGESEPNWKIETSDPFVIGSDGKLLLN